ncbi:ribosomal protein L5 domain-containing protein [Polychytrium aggregatum]|uniref:ribosomal protein L5 domain-containing protein n=1 Tax=Polychytrium aggregatum TaxID=110093 RepID=UPI0022FDB62F|nr:ribosomal protein L5 domain-containing protein [Polychytrium aggregatum]KAI9207849.1 ribosomal protein L5 domain-containing protein [Polychytrium aggregatum]
MAKPKPSASSEKGSSSSPSQETTATSPHAPLADQVVRVRLEEHYYNTLLEDIMILSYDHSSPTASLEAALPALSRKLPENALEDLFSTPFSDLPTHPTNNVTTHFLLSNENSGSVVNFPKRSFAKKKLNPIDYTIVKKEVMTALPPLDIWKPFSPSPKRLPLLRKVTVKVWEDSAAHNKSLLLGAIMNLQSITGVEGTPLFSDKSDASRKIRAGMPLGAKVDLYGDKMYEFVDKLNQCVLPRLREWEGINPVGNNLGALKLELPESAMGYFPDIEPHFDMFPRMFKTEITFFTTARNDRETMLLLSGFQLPFLDKPIVQLEETSDDNSDPWAKFYKTKRQQEMRKQKLMGKK